MMVPKLVSKSGGWLVAVATLVSSPASATNKYLEIPPVEEATGSRAYRYANLSNEEALAELARRRIPFEPAEPPMPGVRLPIQLTGRLHGVRIHSVLPDHEAARTPFEIMDGRLALALDDFCLVLARHDVVELIHFTIYRPSPTLASSPDAPQTRHPGGMAIDLGAIKKRDGRMLAVGPHWAASIGAKTCGTDARKLVGRYGRELMSILCEAYDQRIFHYMLSPHFDEPHSDHLHLEIKAGVKWFIAN